MLKNKRNIITASLLAFVLTAMIFVACEKTDVTPMDQTSGVLDKKGGNGGGGNNPNTPNYNPCTWVSQYTTVNNTSLLENWNITVDTSVCGFVILRWDAQPKFVAGSDGCTIAGQYLVATAALDPSGSTGSPCAGNVTTTNAYYYQLGSGCSMWPGKEYRIGLSYLEKDTVNKKLIWHYSQPVQFFTGKRASFLGTCP